MYEFFRERLNIIGIDENGYGPLLGPLVISGIKLNLEGEDPLIDTEVYQFRFPLKLKDSKYIFTRSPASYRTGESIALELLRIIGVKPESFSQLISSVSLRPVDFKQYGIEDFDIPVFGERISFVGLYEFFEKLGIEISGIRANILMADVFNSKIKELGNKALLDFQGFLDLARELADEENTYILCGKIGGTKRYSPFFESLNIEHKMVKESRNISQYLIGKKHNIFFILNGDEKYLPVMLVSILGKYIRELFMLALSRKFGYDTPIPFASGYRHDKKTYEIFSLLSEEERKLWVRIR